MICMKLQLLTRPADLKRWDTLVHEVASTRRDVVKIGMCGKYTDLSDSYKSLNEALRHAGIHNHARSTSSTSTPRR
jgi:CTP synthase